MNRLLVLLGICLAAQAQELRRVGYFSNTAQFRPVGGKFFPEDIDASLVNTMVYHKAVINNECEIVYSEFNDEEMYTRFNIHKLQNPGLVTLLAVKRTASECDIGDKNSRLTFANSAVEFLRDHNFDGLDIHFEVAPVEYPNFKDDFTALLQEVRAAFDDEDNPGQDTLLLTATVSAKKEDVDEYYDVPELVIATDWLGLKTYDFRGPGPDRHIGMVYNHAPLFGRMDDQEEAEYLNVENASQYWIDSGAPAEHLLIGVAALAVGFVLENEAGCPDVHCPTTGPSTMGYYTREDGIISHYEKCSMYNGDNGVEYWDDEQQVPYTISTSDGEWIGHEDQTSAQAKANWLIDNGFGGWMMWTFDLDDFTGMSCETPPYPLLNALNSASKK